MENLFNMGRIFYAIAIAEIGVQSIYCLDFPYMLPLPAHFWIAGRVVLAVIFGLMCVVAAVFIFLEKRIRQVSALFGTVLLVLFCFYYIPYEFLTSPNFMHLGEWENAEKELALAGGAFVIAGCFSETNKNRHFRFLGKQITFGAILFSVTMISFGILHFLEAEGVSTMIPTWISHPLFWAYAAGVALIGSGISIIFKIKTGLFASLLGAMILTWFLLLHIPRVVAAQDADLGGEVTSAFLALAYSGIAFVIAGAALKLGWSGSREVRKSESQ